MIYLALGSNLGDRASHLRRALRCLVDQNIVHEPIRFSPVYEAAAMLPAGAPTAWNLPFLNMVVEADASLHPVSLLTAVKKIERDLGRVDGERWAPRSIDIDVLTYHGQKHSTGDLRLPHSGLLERDFVLRPLRDLTSEIDTGDGFFLVDRLLNQLQSNKTRKLPISILPTAIMGVVNITPDSFSDGGRWFELSNARAHIDKLIQAGAAVIDIGAESTRPGAASLTVEDEWSRLEPVLKFIAESRERYPWLKWSLDSRRPAVCERALDFGIHWINDVSGGDDPAMKDLWRQNRAERHVFMHHLGVPANPERVIPHGADPTQAILQWADKRLHEFASMKLDPCRLVFDPGIGFGKTASQSLQILNHLNVFGSLGVELLIGHSRKSFYRLITDRPANERDLETATSSSILSKVSVDYLRVHDVESSIRAIRAAFLIKDQRKSDQ